MCGRLIQRSHFNDFLRGAALPTMLAAIEIPGLMQDLVVSFLTIGEGDPGVSLAERTTKADSEVCRHAVTLQFQHTFKTARGCRAAKGAHSKSNWGWEARSCPAL